MSDVMSRQLRQGARKSYAGLDEGSRDSPMVEEDDEHPEPRKRGRPPSKDGPKRKVGRPPKVQIPARPQSLQRPAVSDEQLLIWRQKLEGLPDDDEVHHLQLPMCNSGVGAEDAAFDDRFVDEKAVGDSSWAVDEHAVACSDGVAASATSPAEAAAASAAAAALAPAAPATPGGARLAGFEAAPTSPMQRCSLPPLSSLVQLAPVVQPRIDQPEPDRQRLAAPPEAISYLLHVCTLLAQLRVQRTPALPARTLRAHCARHADHVRPTASRADPLLLVFLP